MQEKIGIKREILPTNLTSEDIALLNTSRQNIMTKLCFGGKTLSRLAEEVGLQPSSVFDNLELLNKNGFVKKDDNKVFSLTTKGKTITFFLLKPNGINEEKIRELFNAFLKDELGIENPEEREEYLDSRGQIL